MIPIKLIKLREIISKLPLSVDDCDELEVNIWNLFKDNEKVMKQ